MYSVWYKYTFSFKYHIYWIRRQIFPPCNVGKKASLGTIKYEVAKGQAAAVVQAPTPDRSWNWSHSYSCHLLPRHPLLTLPCSLKTLLPQSPLHTASPSLPHSSLALLHTGRLRPCCSLERGAHAPAWPCSSSVASTHYYGAELKHCSVSQAAARMNPASTEQGGGQSGGR